MSAISLNCRGLGNQATVRELRKVVKQEGHALLFVMETKIKGKRVEALRTSLGFAGCFAVDSDGLSGGIGLFWNHDVVVDIKKFSNAHIDSHVRWKDKDLLAWRFTGFYGEPRAENRHQSWDFLHTLFANPHDGWLCVGDFNETMYAEEHFGAHARPENRMRAFREVIDFCSSQDLGWRGVPFTWDNKQQGSSNVKARLDRALANASFLSLFEFTSVKHISSVVSDHCYVVTELRSKPVGSWPMVKRSFRYENVWQSHSEYDALVKNLWTVGAGNEGLNGVVTALNTIQHGLGSWGDREFGNLNKKVRKLQKNLERVRGLSVGRGSSDEEKVVVAQLREALRQEEVWMLQRSLVQWLREGDRNTKYFHAQAAHRKRINRITSLENGSGVLCDDPEDITSEISGFYQNLYLSQGYNDMSQLLNIVEPKISNEMNAGLEEDFTAEEIKCALFQMAPSKAPGVDGFTAGFFQRHWNILGDDIVKATRDFLNGGELRWD